MDQIRDRPGTGACAKGTLPVWMRASGLLTLLMGAVLASTFLVDPPISVGRGSETQPYVPASDTWIELGNEPGAAARRKSPVEAIAPEEVVAPNPVVARDRRVEQGTAEPSKAQHRKSRDVGKAGPTQASLASTASSKRV